MIEIDFDFNLSINFIHRERRKSDKPSDEGKWKMMFSKDTKKDVSIPKQSAFPGEDEPESDHCSDRGSEKKSPDRKSQSHHQSTSRSRYDDSKSLSTYGSTNLPPIPPVGPSVLDKFGNFRRAPIIVDPNVEKPPEPPAYRHSRSRSRSRSDSRRSRSRSHSRRSRSRSYRRSAIYRKLIYLIG